MVVNYILHALTARDKNAHDWKTMPLLLEYHMQLDFDSSHVDFSQTLTNILQYYQYIGRFSLMKLFLGLNDAL